MNKFKKINIFISDIIHEDGLNLLKSKFKVFYKHGLSNSELLRYISLHHKKYFKNDALIIRSTRKIDKDFIKNLRNLTGVRVICTVSSGFDNIDAEACKKYNIKMFNVPNGNYISAAEHTFALILAIIKKIAAKNTELQKGRFRSVSGETTELYNKTIGIIGVGRVGSYVAGIAKSFGMNILGNDIKKSLKYKYKWIKFVSLKKLLKASDIISVHTPLDKSTRDLINKKNIVYAKKGSVFINCARGGIINEKTLYHYLKRGNFNYAGLDVFENEPDINYSLILLNNVISTPHIGGKTKESYKRMSLQASQQLINFYKQLKLIEIQSKIQ